MLLKKIILVSAKLGTVMSESVKADRGVYTYIKFQEIFVIFYDVLESIYAIFVTFCNFCGVFAICDIM